ncbi:proteasome subunit alpha type-4-like [Hibiscus syriacus]|uniref:Proteasome subunit alpha type-4-like n=1 Tax=Hibiscus syriacus TaxID=106335 RepID=A0A6A3CTZ7_HIBSY|nr:probably inactive leucine-rich repeat receptor-like protein kinase IMK2 [Hibiscus syriacus]KAE8732760.1 proteasome subunit alpha type-4-like [Hibiscus syriacus]
MALRYQPRLPLLLVLLLLFSVSSAVSSLKISAIDLAALSAIKDSLTDIPGSRFFSTWDFASPDPCSSFTGVTCGFNGRVNILSLGTGLSDSPGLAGSLSPALSNLTMLTQLILFPGLVTGPIPPQLGQLTGLRVISLTNNRLTGPIPSSFSNLPFLHTLDLSSNHLSGFIPPGLTKLPSLKILVLSSNELTGELPLTVSARLLDLDLKKNKINGPLPRLPSTVRYLSVSDNSMWGPLSSLHSLSELVYLDISMNRFSGPVPASLFFNNPSLTSLFLQRNNLSGGLPSIKVDPTTVQSYGEVSIVDLSHNFITGEITALLAGVETLFLNNNRLIGSVPEEYVKSVYDGTTSTLYLQHNYLSGFPLPRGSTLPDTVSVCLSYNCMEAPVGISACPASARREPSRPESQCSVFSHHGSVD